MAHTIEMDEDFVHQQAPGALAKGTIIYKINTEPGDLMPDGTKGEIIGSINHKTIVGDRKVNYGYFVQWDKFENIVFICDYRIATKWN